MLVTCVKFEDEGLIVGVRPRWRRARCSGCDARCTTYDTAEPRRWRHLGHGRLLFWLEYTPRRADCAKCGVLVEKVPWARPGSRFTRDFEELAAPRASTSPSAGFFHGARGVLQALPSWTRLRPARRPRAGTRRE